MRIVSNAEQRHQSFDGVQVMYACVLGDSDSKQRHRMIVAWRCVSVSVDDEVLSKAEQRFTDCGRRVSIRGVTRVKALNPKP